MMLTNKSAPNHQGGCIHSTSESHHSASSNPHPALQDGPQLLRPTTLDPAATQTGQGICRNFFVPLRKWIQDETVELNTLIQDQHSHIRHKKESTLRKTTVAYGIAELLNHVVQSCQTTLNMLHRLCSMDNFEVRVSGEGAERQAFGNEDETADPSWKVTGVDMISPRLSLRIIAPNFSDNDFFDERDAGIIGRDVEVEIASPLTIRHDEMSSCDQSDEIMLCYLFGVLLYKLFSRLHPYQQKLLQGHDLGKVFDKTKNEGDKNDDTIEEPISKKKTSSSSSVHSDGAYLPMALSVEESSFSIFPSIADAENGEQRKAPHGPSSSCVPLTELGCSSSIWLLVRNLLDCGLGIFRPDDSYLSLKAAVEDLRLLLLDPEHFLFEYYQCTGQSEPSLQGGRPLQIRKEKIYGRNVETSQITDAFCRVATSGESEAFFVGGFSGSGKSRLVQCAFVPVEVAGGYVIVEKFDEFSNQSPLSVVLSAFNDLCMLVKERNSIGELHAIIAELMTEFGNTFPLLARILPNVHKLICRYQSTMPYLDNSVGDDINFSSLCFTIQRFMRVISGQSRPVMLFLDDLQWADAVSLGVVHAVLSDMKGSSCVFFIGSYRNNEVHPEHAIFGFMEKLAVFDVPSTNLHLEGIEKDDLNSMISDMLCIYPRLCKTLSCTVHHKTQGNPFFALEFLRSLVDRGLVQYSFRERRWVWDDYRILSEDITDNVLHLLTTNMIGLPNGMQDALKVASCFGTRVNSCAVEILSRTAQHSNFKKELDQAVCDGFMYEDGSGYKFVHDKVREAAYGLIKLDERNQYHYNIGMTMYSSAKEQIVGELLFLIVDQINHGAVSTLKCPSQQTSVVELNFEAGTKAMNCSNFMSAYSYLNAGILLLPDDSWSNHYDLCLNLFLLHAKAARASGLTDEAYHSLNKVLEKGHCLEDKLDAYLLTIPILLAKKNVFNALRTCREVLGLLGEDVPDSVEEAEIILLVEETQRMFEGLSDYDLLSMQENNDKNYVSIMQFYSELVLAGFYAKSPLMHHYYHCRWAQLSLRKGFCKYTAGSFAHFASTLGGTLSNQTPSAYRIGKVALSLLKKYDITDEIPRVYLCFYSYVAILTEPFQSCADMLRRGYEIAMPLGITALGFYNWTLMVPRSIFGGTNLSILEREIDGQLKLIRSQSQSMLETYLLIFQETVLRLMGKVEKDSVNGEIELEVKNGHNIADYSETLCCHRLMSSYWLGHYDRAKYYAEKWTPNNKSMTSKTKLRCIMTAFYFGLTSSAIFRRKKCSKPKSTTMTFISTTKNAAKCPGAIFRSKKFLKLISTIMNSISTMKDAEKYSNWNFQNKVFLLEAELFSIEERLEDAAMSYNYAIEAARRSKFVHEQGLACELAGIHYKNIGDEKKAFRLFHEARQCYIDYGSLMKLNFIDNQLEMVI